MNKGTDESKEHPENIPLKLVTDEVLNSGTASNDVHPRNICAIFVTAAVLNNGTDFSETQLANIPPISCTAEVSNSGTCSSEKLPLKRFVQLFGFPVFSRMISTCSSARHPLNREFNVKLLELLNSILTLARLVQVWFSTVEDGVQVPPRISRFSRFREFVAVPVESLKRNVVQTVCATLISRNPFAYPAARLV